MDSPGPFAVHLRDLIRRRSITYRALAARTHYSKSHLHDLATGRKNPTPEAAARLDHALNAAGALTAIAAARAAAARAGGPPSDLTARWCQPDAEHLAHLLTAGHPTAENALSLAHQWLITEPPQVYELRAGRRVGRASVERVEQRVRQLRRLDDHIGGGETYALVSAELSGTAALIRDGAYPDHIGRRLLSAVADLAQLGGFVAADAGRLADARRLYAAGVRAGHAAADPAAAANNLSSMAYLEANAGNPHDAVILARSAYVGAHRSADPVTRALLLEYVAWAQAVAGDPAAAGRALGQVEDVYDPGRLADAPPWAYWLTPGEVEIMAGRVWTRLRRPLRAVPILERATAGYGDDSPRETALYLTWLAEAQTQAGEVEAAAATADRALALARRAASARAVDRVAEVARLLVDAAPRSAEVARLAEACAELSAG